jgi:hypothetical protein
MKTTNLINRVASVTGLILGAFALSALAAGVWTAPPSGTVPPNNNTEAPLNVGSDHQNKVGSLTVNTNTVSPDPYGLDVFGISRFFGNVEIGTGASPKTIKIVDGNEDDGKVLTSDENGVASWQDLASLPAGDSCELVAETGLSGTQEDTFDVPATCINNSCTVAMAIHDTSNWVIAVRTTSLIQFADSAKSTKGGILNWWAKNGGDHDGTTCDAGLNGGPSGCDEIVKWSNGTNDIKVMDDFGTQNTTTHWTLRDGVSDRYGKVYVCK